MEKMQELYMHAILKLLSESCHKSKEQHICERQILRIFASDRYFAYLWATDTSHICERQILRIFASDRHFAYLRVTDTSHICERQILRIFVGDRYFAYFR